MPDFPKAALIVFGINQIFIGHNGIVVHIFIFRVSFGAACTYLPK
jgi:hypothetical protein